MRDEDTLLSADLARIDRASAFARTRAAAAADIANNLSPGPMRAALETQIQAMRDAADHADARVAACRALPGDEARASIAEFKQTEILDAIRGLDAAATAARVHRPPVGPARPLPLPLGVPRPGGDRLTRTPPDKPPTARTTGPFPHPPTPDDLTGRLRAWAAAFEGPGRALAAPVAPDPRTLAQLDAALKLVTAVIGYVTPRMKPVACALDASDEAPGAPVIILITTAKRRAESEVDEAQRGWVPHLVRLFADRPLVRRPARVAVTQWRQAIDLRAEADAIRAQMATAPLAERTALLTRIRAEKLRGAVLPLGNLHVTFAGVPHLQDLFPPPKKSPPKPGM